MDGAYVQVFGDLLYSKYGFKAVLQYEKVGNDRNQ